MSDQEIIAALRCIADELRAIRRHLDRDGRKRPRRRTPSVDENFCRFWRAYPRRVGKIAAERAWANATKIASANAIIAAAEAFAPTGEAQGKFCPHPATWLNQGRWEDEVIQRFEP